MPSPQDVLARCEVDTHTAASMQPSPSHHQAQGRTHSAVLYFPLTCCFALETKLELSISYSFSLPKGPCILHGLTEAGSSHTRSPQPCRSPPCLLQPSRYKKPAGLGQGRRLQGKQAGATRVIEGGKQRVTGKNKEGSGCRAIWCFCSVVFLADLSCLATGCLGPRHPPSRHEHCISCPTG